MRRERRFAARSRVVCSSRVGAETCKCSFQIYKYYIYKYYSIKKVIAIILAIFKYIIFIILNLRMGLLYQAVSPPSMTKVCPVT